MKIVIVPSTLRAGAKRCMTVAREANAAAVRVGALSAPEGMPAEATVQLRAAMAQLQRSCDAAEHESQFLVARAQRGLMADGPFGSMLDLLGPQLLSPWAMPAAAPHDKHEDHHWYDGPAAFVDGAVDEVADTFTGLADTGAGIAGHAIDGDLLGPAGPLLHHLGVPRLSDHIPYVAAKRKELDAAVDWAARHPDQFAAAVGKDLTAWDDHASGDDAHGFGRNAVGILGLLAPITKVKAAGGLTKAAAAARRSEAAAGRALGDARAAQNAARVDHVLAGSRRPGESIAAYELRQRQAHYELTRSQGISHLAEERLKTEVQEAHDAAERAAQARREARDEAAKAASETGGKVLGSHDEAAQ